jgi:hypothetical protein
MKQLTFSWEERPANHSLPQDSEKGLMTFVVNSQLDFPQVLNAIAPSGSCGKMSLESCQAGEDGTLLPSANRWSNSGMACPGESWTLSTSESHKGEDESLLSDILETGDIPPRFFLSQKACAGILRRADKRGKELPEILRHALTQVMARNTE